MHELMFKRWTMPPPITLPKTLPDAVVRKFETRRELIFGQLYDIGGRVDVTAFYQGLQEFDEGKIDFDNPIAYERITKLLEEQGYHSIETRTLALNSLVDTGMLAREIDLQTRFGYFPTPKGYELFTKYAEHQSTVKRTES